VNLLTGMLLSLSKCIGIESVLWMCFETAERSQEFGKWVKSEEKKK
jgi:hypothetical protein